MRVSIRATVLVALVLGMSVALLWAADPPYAGTWKLNAAKSDFGETTITYEEIGGGEMKVTGGGQSYTFKADGKDYPTPWGTSDAWKTIDASSWEVTSKANDKVVSTATLKLAADGKTLTVDAKNLKATGETSNDSTMYERQSGASGLAGTWKTKNLKIGSPGTVTITPSGSDGVTLTFVEEKGTCSAKFDGKEYPATGPIWPSGWTCTVGKSSASALEVTWKKDGKVRIKDEFTPSADGKTLTDLNGAPATTEKVKLVYDRQ
jgi:hypothetical protein